MGNWKSRGRIVGNRCNFVESWKGERPGCYRTQQQKGKIVVSHYAPDFPKGKASSGWRRLKERGLELPNRVTPRGVFSRVRCGGSDQKMKGGGEREVIFLCWKSGWKWKAFCFQIGLDFLQKSVLIMWEPSFKTSLTHSLIAMSSPSSRWHRMGSSGIEFP